MNARFENIIKDISKKIQNEIENYYLTLTDENEKRKCLANGKVYPVFHQRRPDPNPVLQPVV